MSEPDQKIPCPVCRTSNNAADQRCISCGALLHQETQPAVQPQVQAAPIPEPVPERRSPLLYIVCAIVPIVLIAAFLLTRPKPPQPPSPQQIALQKTLIAKGYIPITQMDKPMVINRQLGMCGVPRIMLERSSTRGYQTVTEVENSTGRRADLYLTAYAYDANGAAIGSGVLVNTPLEFIRAGETGTFGGRIRTTSDLPIGYIYIVEGKDAAEKASGGNLNMSFPATMPESPSQQQGQPEQQGQ